MRILNISNDREKILMSYAPECWQDITELASRPHGLRQQMSASTVDIFLLPDRVRVICDRPEQTWGYVVDIIDPGEYRVDHFSFNRVVEIDPERYEAEEWYPWESSDDFMRKVAAEDPDSGFVFVRPRPVEPEPMPDLAPPPRQEAWRKTLYGAANKPWTDLTAVRICEEFDEELHHLIKGNPQPLATTTEDAVAILGELSFPVADWQDGVISDAELIKVANAKRKTYEL